MPVQDLRPTPRAPRPPPIAAADWPAIASAGVLAAGLLVIYGRTFSVPFLFDDHPSIVDNPTIRHLWPLWPALHPPADAGTGGRPLLNLSFALNYAAGGTAVFGYHAVNLLIHGLAAWILFALARQTLRGPVLAPRFGPSATALALGIAAIWAWHPLQTESVTYLSQRSESLMGVGYLGTLYGFVRGAESERGPNRQGWFLLSFLACLAGTMTKEVIATDPLAVFLYDRTFVSLGFSRAWRRHWPVYLALAATWIPLGCLAAGLADRGVGLGQGVSWWAYGLTEARALVRYLLLAVWPRPLVFDYGKYLPIRPVEAAPYLLILAVLLALAAAALRRWPPAGFAACWFFLILAPTSSVIPILGQPMAENRLYLPLAGIVSLAVLGAFAVAGRRALPVLAAIAALLAVAAAGRNRDYASERAIWSDTVAKRPDNPWARNNLGLALEDSAAQLPEAIAQFQAALRLRPDYARAHYNLGDAWLKLPGHLQDGIDELETAVRLEPDYAEARDNLGNALAQGGRLHDAAAQYEEALRLKPGDAEAHYNLGNLWLRLPGHRDDAKAQLEAALRLQPDLAEAHFDLGEVWATIPGRLSDAIAQYQEALRWRPDYPEACNNLGNALLPVPGRTAEAIAYYQSALRLRPDYPEAHNNLGNAWLKTPGRLNEAISEFQEALRLKPDYAEAHYNLGCAWMGSPARLSEAIAQLEAAVRLKPDYPEAHNNLGSAWLKVPGGSANAAAQYEEALRERPDFAAAHFNLAIALLSSPGGAEAAKTQLEAFLRLQPGNQVARQLLARIQAATR